ncbi:MAG: hypothetical protein RJA81_1307, partial [Planctomycetota bacterium]
MSKSSDELIFRYLEGIATQE